jgi:hypothetical protein|eukprot:g7857.t1
MANLFSGDAPVRFEFQVKDVVEKVSPPPKPKAKTATKVGIGASAGKGSPKPKLQPPVITKRTKFRGQFAGQHLKASGEGNVDDTGGPGGLTKDNPNIVSFSKFTPSEETEKKKEKAEPKTVVLEELSVEPGSLLPPSKRQQYFERPAIRGRVRFDRYREHRIRSGGRNSGTRPNSVGWNNSIILDRADDFRKDMEGIVPVRMRPRSTQRRRELTGKAIQNYKECIARPTMSKKERQKPWNQVTRAANFRSALKSQKGDRARYAYGVKPKTYKGVAYTLAEDEQLGYNFDIQVGREPEPRKKVIVEKEEGQTMKFVRTGYRLVPYETANRTGFQAEPTAGFVLSKSVSTDRVKVLKKVNLGSKSHRRKARRKPGEEKKQSSQRRTQARPSTAGAGRSRQRK